MQALQFMFYERMKTIIANKKKRRLQLEEIYSNQNQSNKNQHNSSISYLPPLDAAEVFLAGAVSGATAAFLTNPIDTVTARLMTQGHGSLVETNSKTASTLPSLKYSTSVIECGKTIVREEGVTSLMRGWFPRTIRFGILGALTLAVYEKLRDVMGFEDDDD